MTYQLDPVLKALGFTWLKVHPLHPFQAIGSKCQPAPLQLGVQVNGVDGKPRTARDMLQAKAKLQLDDEVVASDQQKNALLTVGRCKLLGG